jgi:hypothetical protein
VSTMQGEDINIGDLVERRKGMSYGPDVNMLVLEKEIMWPKHGSAKTSSDEAFYVYVVLRSDGLVKMYTDSSIIKGGLIE